LTIPRTEGVSTTDIVGRMLLLTSSHHESPDCTDNNTPTEDKLVRSLQYDSLRKSNFLTTSRIIRLFGAGVKVKL
jgi:ethanolamine-phosphate cytidylyltransferase